MYLAHQRIFSLKVLGGTSPSWRVISFHAEQNFYGQPEIGEVEIFLDRSQILPHLIGKKVCLEVGSYVVMDGVVESLAYERYDDEGHYLRSTIVSPVYDCLRYAHNRIFNHKTIQEIVTEILKLSGWKMDQISFSLSESVPFRFPSFRQHEESDWIFFHRLLHQAGWFYQIQILESQTHLVVSDSLNKFSEKPKVLNSDGLYLSRQIFQLKPSHNHVRGFCKAVPAMAVDWCTTSKNTLSAYGEEYQHQLCGLWEKDQVKRYAQQCCARLDHERNGLWVQTEEMGLSLWDKVQLSCDGQDKSYRVMAIRHQGEENRGEQLRYSAELELIPIDASEDLFQYVRDAHEKNIGLWPAEVLSLSDDVADLDGSGGYQVKYPSAESSYSRSARIPKALEFFHDKTGSHFPLKAKHFVVMIHREEDGNRPVILSAMSDHQHPDLVTQNNPHQHWAKTGNGHELLLDDQPSASQLSLQTFDQSEMLLLSQKSKKNGHGISLLALKNKKGAVQIEIAKNSEFLAAGNMVLDTNGKNELIVHQNAFWKSIKKQINIHTKGNHVWKAKSTAGLHSDRAMDMISGDYQRWWGAYELKITSSSLQMISAGPLEMSAGQVLTISGNATFSCGGSSLAISGGQATIQANHITVIGI